MSSFIDLGRQHRERKRAQSTSRQTEPAPPGPIKYEPLATYRGSWEDRQKPRTWPNPGRLIGGLLLNLACWVSAAGVIALGVVYAMNREQTWLLIALGGIGLHIFFRILRYFNGLKCRCPLCHGTPLHATRSSKHRLANRIPLAGYRASAVLSAVCRGRFSCMYCGTPFKLGK